MQLSSKNHNASIFLAMIVWAVKEAEKEEERVKKVQALQKLVTEHEAAITIDDDTIRQELEYDPSKDTSVEAVIIDGFQNMRVQGCPEVVSKSKKIYIYIYCCSFSVKPYNNMKITIVFTWLFTFIYKIMYNSS